MPESRVKAAAKTGRVAVVDIGSNTVRLVVYELWAGVPLPMFNEKTPCRLVRGLAETGRLNPDGVERAFRGLTRFIHLSAAMGVDRLDLVATAAVREAADGPSFARRVHDRFGIPVTVLSSEEEARLAALGLLSSVPDADGLLIDLGGGSAELVALVAGACSQSVSLPLGHLRLPELAQGDPSRARVVVDGHLDAVPWLAAVRGRSLYTVGGAPRTLAHTFIEQTGYPLHVVDNYAIRRSDAVRLMEVIANLSPDATLGISTVPPGRAGTLPFAAMVLKALLDRSEPEHLVFSGFGMREGHLLQGLPRRLRGQDPLIAGCRNLARRTRRFSIRGEEIRKWLAPIFVAESEADARLRHAATLISDMGWTEHPDYRAEHAFHRALRLPFARLTHADRVFLALAVFIRYGGRFDAPVVRPVLGLLEQEDRTRAETLGRALRLAHTISGSAPELLPQTRLRLVDGTLSLMVPEIADVFVSETVERRLMDLADALGCDGRIAT